jgi:hypothetical protein
VRGYATPAGGTWITPSMIDAYRDFTRAAPRSNLRDGTRRRSHGVALGRILAGIDVRPRDRRPKVALAILVGDLRARGIR